VVIHHANEKIYKTRVSGVNQHLHPPSVKFQLIRRLKDSPSVLDVTARQLRGNMGRNEVLGTFQQHFSSVALLTVQRKLLGRISALEQSGVTAELVKYMEAREADTVGTLKTFKTVLVVLVPQNSVGINVSGRISFLTTAIWADQRNRVAAL